jgi:hypothetical protein
MALNRLAEVRLNLIKFGQNTDTGELGFANRTWHYDTRYFDTSFPSMKRVVVRVYAGNAKTKGNPLAETTGFLSTALSPPGSGSSNVDWTAGGIAALGGTDGAPGSAPVTPPNGTNPLTVTPTPPATPAPTPTRPYP